jgi:Arc/MetJ-type ribon-helix-helix transcriptional regulator
MDIGFGGAEPTCGAFGPLSRSNFPGKRGENHTLRVRMMTSCQQHGATMASKEQGVERMTISMPKSMVAKIEAKMAEEDFSSVSEWIRDAVRRRLQSADQSPRRKMGDDELMRRADRAEAGSSVEGDVIASIRKSRPRRAG